MADAEDLLQFHTPPNHRNAGFGLLGHVDTLFMGDYGAVRKDLSGPSRDALGYIMLKTKPGELSVVYTVPSEPTNHERCAAALRHPSAARRTEAANSLRMACEGSAPHAGALAESVNDKEPDVREAATLALGSLGDSAVPHAGALALALKDRRRRLQHTGQHEGHTADPFEGLWATAPQDGDWHGRRAAAAALAGLGPQASAQAVDIALALLDRSAAVRQAADEALHATGPQGAAQLAGALRHAEPKVRKAAALALGSLGLVAAPHADALKAAVRDGDPDVRRAALEALEALGPAVPFGPSFLSRRMASHRHGRSLQARRLAGGDAPRPIHGGVRGAPFGGRHHGLCSYPAARCTCRRV